MIKSKQKLIAIIITAGLSGSIFAGANLSKTFVTAKLEGLFTLVAKPLNNGCIFVKELISASKAHVDGLASGATDLDTQLKFITGWIPQLNLDPSASQPTALQTALFNFLDTSQSQYALTTSNTIVYPQGATVSACGNGSSFNTCSSQPSTYNVLTMGDGTTQALPTAMYKADGSTSKISNGMRCFKFDDETYVTPLLCLDGQTDVIAGNTYTATSLCPSGAIKSGTSDECSATDSNNFTKHVFKATIYQQINAANTAVNGVEWNVVSFFIPKFTLPGGGRTKLCMVL